jgi:hypothetical protein
VLCAAIDTHKAGVCTEEAHHPLEAPRQSLRAGIAIIRGRTPCGRSRAVMWPSLDSTVAATLNSARAALRRTVQEVQL